MASCARKWRVSWLLLLLLHAFTVREGRAQNDTCLETEQPVLSTVDPPSGIREVIYTITGSELDQVVDVLVEQDQTELGVMVLEINSSSIQFTIIDLVDNGIATVTLQPNNSACNTSSGTIDLRRFGVSTSPASQETAQPGTTIYVPGCFPPECGDNSVNYRVTVGGLNLELLQDPMPQGTEFFARFPNSDTAMDGAKVNIISDYATYVTSANIDFFLPGTIMSIVPSSGQRGTRVTIIGNNLLGVGDTSDPRATEVELGGSLATIDSFSQTEITVIAATGIPNESLVRINTTQDVFSRQGISVVDFCGPYTYADGLWTQLEDGVLTDVVPPAAQAGRTVFLCGQRLLGGGNETAEVTLSGQPVPTGDFSVTPFAGPGVECINVTVPEAAIPEEGISGTVTLVADSEAIVESASENVTFSYAIIRSVSPNTGQFGTRVTIRGLELLSGYSVEPEVYLAGVQATVLSASSSMIVVQAEMPPEPTSGMMDLGLDMFGISGDVEITVNSTSLFAGSLFTVSSEGAWTYETQGEIEEVIPPFGQYGTLLNITGTNLLGYGTSIVRVTVNGTEAMVNDDFTNETVIIEAPDLDGVGLVTIVIFADTGAQVIGENQFEYRERGRIDTVSPESGQNGTYVTINGTNLFGYGNSITSVTFGDTQATVDPSLASDTQIRVRIQANNNSADQPVAVTILADTSAIVASDGEVWTYLVQGEVVDVTPDEGQEGTRVQITGTNLLGGGSSVQGIFLDGVPGTVASDPAPSPTSITVVVMAIEDRMDFFSGQVFIMADTGAVVIGGSYTHRASGRITSITPQQGREGTRITGTGVNLLGFGNRIVGVEIAGVPGIFESFEDDEVIVRAGPASDGTLGPVQLMIDTGAVVSSIIGIEFTYDPPGNITDVTPLSGAEGSGVLISGTALQIDNIPITSVTIGGSPVSRIVTASETEISVIAGPAPATGPSNAEINVTASDGSFIRGAFFTYVDLTVSLRNQNSGQEGTRIEIVVPPTPLSSFIPSFNLRVFVGCQEVTVEAVDVAGGFITVRVPRATRPGTYTADVAVESTDRLVARLRDGFTYFPEGVIYSVTPNLGQRGTRITLEGENLLGGGNTLDSIEFTPSNPAVEVTVANDSVVELVLSENPDTVPGGGIQTDIILTADTGAIIRRLNGFTLVQPGQIASVSPPSGQFATRVAISGTNLLQGGSANDINSITLAGVGASVLGAEDGFTDPSDTQITVSAASASATSGVVEIILVSGAIITSDSGVTFQYIEEGVITDVNPDSGPIGTRVNIIGTNLLGGGDFPFEIRLAGIPANITFVAPNGSLISVVAEEPTSPVGTAVEIIANTGAIVREDSLWTYETLGSITSVDPTIGQQGVVATIRGDSLLGSADRIAECSLAGVPGEVVSFDDDMVMCRAGFNSNSQSGANPDGLSGPVELRANSGAVITSNTSDPDVLFTYYIATIDSIEPTSGMNGTLVSITGLNLAGFPSSDFEVTGVTIGGVAAAIVSSSNSFIQIRAGESSNATLDDTVQVVSSSGAIVELSDAWNYTEPGQIDAVLPEDGVPGDTITITGENLVPPCVSEVRVILGETESYTARVVNTSIVEFRPGVFQTSLDPGENAVSPGEALPVQIIAGNGATVYTNTVQFRYNATGMVTSITPTAGVGGMEVTITGTDLLSGSEVIRITLAGVDATVMNASETEVTVIAGATPMEGASGGVVIEASNGQLTGVAGDVWTYFPVITAADVSPQMGQNGTTVELDLTQIQDSFDLERVLLAGVPAELVGNTTGVVTVVAGESEELPVGNIMLEFAGNLTLVIPDAWGYQPPVQITSLSQDSGYYNSLVVITGESFQPGATNVADVYLAGLETDIEFASNTEIRVRITQMEDSSAGAIEGPIVIRSENGATFTSQQTFTYVQLRVDSVDPVMGQGGTVVTIQGVGLLAGFDGTPSLDVTLGGILADPPSMLTNTDVVFRASSSPNETDVGDIVYVVNGGATVTIPNSWSYVEPGEITGISPAQGNNGTIITITGRRMFAGGSAAASVRLGTAITTDILVNDENLVQVRANLSGTPGDETVTVIADSGAETAAPMDITFEYLPPGAITNFLPGEGQNGTRVIISGTNIRASGEAIARVLLAGVEAVIEETVEEVSDTVIRVRAGRPSMFGAFSGEITIESERGTTTVSTADFSYLAEGSIFSVNPPRGQTGTRISIMGENLLGGGTDLDAVYIGGVEANITSTNNVAVNVTAGSDGILTGDIVLVSNTGAYVRRIDGWTYVEPGVIETVVPPMGQFGTRITITGTGLLSGGQSITEAFIGEVPVLEVVSSNDTVVIVRAGEQPPSNRKRNAFTGNIILVSNFGGVLDSNETVEYLVQSTIIGVNPLSGRGMTTVTVIGMNLLGGGAEIASATLAGIRATVNISSDNLVTLTSGVNINGEPIVAGDVILESDTGALSIRTNGWTYLRECPVGQFGNFSSCTDCNSECLQCFGPEDDDCTECANFAILSGDTRRCVSQCPNASLPDNTCVDICGTDQYVRTDTVRDATFCTPCNSLCDPTLGCSGPEATECGGCLFFHNTVTQSCVEQCSNGTFIDELNNCVPCDNQCATDLGCRGVSAAECNQCQNLRIQTTVIDPVTMTVGDLCLAECPSTFYLDETTGYCQPCSQECAGNCTGPTPYDCFACNNFSIVFPNGTRRCVPTCNPVPTQLTMYDDINAICQPCSDRCSRAGGCSGPTPSDCLVGCAVNATNNTLPTFFGECRLSCPMDVNSGYFYEDSRTVRCEECDVSCTIGCTGPRPQDCIEADETDLLAAGPVTIAIVVIVCVILFILLVAVVVCVLVRRYKHGEKYEIANTNVELGERYAVAPRVNETAFGEEDEKKRTLEREAASPIGAENTAFQDGELYTEMGPEETEVTAAKPKLGPVVRIEEKLYDKRGNQKKEPEIQELYTDMEPLSKKDSAPVAPARPPKSTPAKQTEKPPAKLPSQTSLPIPMPTEGRPPATTPTKETKPPPRPPSPELYTDMQGSIQEVYVNPEAAEEYSEMAPTHAEPVTEDFYDDATSIQSPTSPSVPITQQPPIGRTEDRAPLISSPPTEDSVYEDADTAVAAAEHYRQTSSSSLLPPQLPSKPIPKKRLSSPLPPTPLEQSLQKAAPILQEEDLYEQTDAGMPIEESLYEAIPTGKDRLIPNQPSPAAPPRGSRK